MSSAWRRLAILGLACTALFMIAGCGGSNDDNESASSTQSSSGTPQIDASNLPADFSEMAKLKDLASEGKGMIGVLLPDTTTSARYVQYDAPYLKKAFETAGLSSDEFKIDNAHGSTSTMQQQAEADITAGASVLLVDPLDPGSGAAIESNAESKGVKVIDYDRLVTGGPEDRYYVSFDNVRGRQADRRGRGRLHQRLERQQAEHPGDERATRRTTTPSSSQQGYNGVLKSHFDDGSYTKVGEPPGTWDPPTAATTFEQQYTAHPNINAVVTPNDDNANAVISVLLKNKIPADKFPTTGQDASPSGLQNILKGYQCGTVYKPILRRGSGGSRVGALSRAGQDAAFVARELDDEGLDSSSKDIKSVYTKPFWVTKEQHGRHDHQGRLVSTPRTSAAASWPSACKEAGIS